MTQVVISVWPFASIRTFSSPNPSNFIINVGRSSPCGEGIFNFISCSFSGGEDLFASLLTKTSPDNYNQVGVFIYEITFLFISFFLKNYKLEINCVESVEVAFLI